MTIFNAHGGLPPVAAKALYTYQTPFSSIYGLGEVKMMEHSTLREVVLMQCVHVAMLILS